MTNTNVGPLRLAVGSHKAGSGRGCAMNVISWENGDSRISDMPDNPGIDPCAARRPANSASLPRRFEPSKSAPAAPRFPRR